MIVELTIGTVLRPAGGEGGSGGNGWTPELAVATDGSRRVQQVVDWFGGAGTKPATGQYVGASGFVSNITDAVAIQGPAGETGERGLDGNDGTSGTPGDNGAPGASAYDIWIGQGNTGSAEDFLISLKGDQGNPGVQGEQGLPGNDGAAGRAIQFFTEIPGGDFGTDYFAGDIVKL